MSRSGKRPIPMPKGVEVMVQGANLKVKGPKGMLQQPLHKGVSVTVEDGSVRVSADETSDIARLHGLTRALLCNMVIGVSQGFEKRLEMIGVGYRAAVKGRNLDIQIGSSHPTELAIPEGISVVVEKNTLIIVTGIDRQRVGQFAADVRAFRPPEPYKGKGIRYVGEYVRRKAGKAAK